MKYILILFFALYQITAAAGPTLPAFNDRAEGEVLRLSGSNTIGAQLAPKWAANYLKAKGAKQIQHIPLNENEVRVMGVHQGKKVYIDIFAHGSSTGFKTLSDKVPSIAMASRPIKDKEVTALQSLGNLREYTAEHVVAIDGLAVIVNPNNPVATLSTEQIAKLFSGQINNWKDVGGQDSKVTLLARDDKSGTWDTFKSLVLQKNYTLSASAQRLESNDELSDIVSSTPGAIGFVGLASVRAAKPLAIIDGGTHALKPEALFVATEDYPLSRRLYLYTPETPRFYSVTEFVQFTQQSMGQNIVEQTGFVSQNPVGLKVEAEGGSEFYKGLTKHASRLSMNFRFQAGRSELDNKAKRDVMRLAEYLKMPENRKLHIQLIGFSDQENKQSLAQVLSKLRASAVKRELFRYGVSTESVEGFGAERPVASESAKNDRVEVWVYNPDDAVVIDELKEQSRIAQTDA